MGNTTDYTVGYVQTNTVPVTSPYFSYASSPFYDNWVQEEHNRKYKEVWKKLMEVSYNPTYYLPYSTEIKEEEKVSDVKKKTVDLFDDKEEGQKLLEDYGIVNEAGDVTDTGLQVLLKLLLSDKRSGIIEKLKADKDSKKKKSTD